MVQPAAVIDERELHTIAARLPSEWRWLGAQLRGALWSIRDICRLLDDPVTQVDTPRVQVMRLRMIDRALELEATVERLQRRILEIWPDPPRSPCGPLMPISEIVINLRALIRQRPFSCAGPPPPEITNARVASTGAQKSEYAVTAWRGRSTHTPSSADFHAQFRAPAFLRPRRGRRRARGPPPCPEKETPRRFEASGAIGPFPSTHDMNGEEIVQVKSQNSPKNQPLSDDTPRQKQRRRQTRARRRSQPRHKWTNHYAQIGRMRSEWACELFHKIAQCEARGQRANLRYIADGIGCPLSTASRVTDTLAACGVIHKSYKERECVFTVNPTCPAPGERQRQKPRKPADVSTFGNKGRSPKGLPPDRITRTPVQASARDRAEPQARPVNTQQDNPAPAVAGPVAPRGERTEGITALGSAVTTARPAWGRQHPDNYARRIRWLIKLLHWAQAKSPDDVPLLDRALWIARTGHWRRDLDPDKHDRINELDDRAKADPLVFEMPDERRRRERLREPPIGGRRAPADAASPEFAASIAATNDRIMALCRRPSVA
jgi:hypothetical protein